MNKKDEALKMAIEAMEFKGVRDSEEYWQMMNATKNACKEALEPEPMTTTDVITCKMAGKCCMTGEALEQSGWQRLTDDEIKKVYDNSLIVHSDTHYEFNNFKYARAIEQASKDKNNVN